MTLKSFVEMNRYTLMAIGIAALLSSAVSCKGQQQNEAELRTYWSETFADKSLDEISAELEMALGQFERFANFFGNREHTPETYTIDEEVPVAPFMLDKGRLTASYAGLKQTSLQFKQLLLEGNSELLFEYAGGAEVEVPEGGQLRYIPKRIWYADGTVETVDTAGIVDFSFSQSWGTDLRAIDSVELERRFTYPERVDEVTVTADNKTADYHGGQLQLVETDQNYVYVTVSDTIDYFRIDGMNQSGEPLDYLSRSSNVLPPGEAEKQFDRAMASITAVVDDIKNEKISSKEELEDRFVSDMADFVALAEGTGTRHLTGYYKGMVDGLRLYIAVGEVEHADRLVARPAEPASVLRTMAMNDDDYTALVDRDGQIRSKAALGLAVITGNFYEDSDHYYYLDTASLQLEPILCYELVELDHGLVGIRYDEDKPFAVLNSRNEQVSPFKYMYLRQYNDDAYGGNFFVLVDAEGRQYTLDESGREILYSAN